MSIFDAIGDFASNLAGGAGTQNRTQIVNPNDQINGNAFQYGGQAGGAAAAQGHLQALGAAGASQAGQQPFQQAQQAGLGLDLAAANGTAPSVAQGQLQQGLAQAQAAQAAGAASSRGGGANLAAAQSNAANAQAGMAAQTNNQSAQLRAGEMAQARGALDQAASGGLGQAMQQNQFNANLQQGYEGQAGQVAQAQLQAQQNQQQLQSNNTLTSQGQASQQAAGNASNNTSMIGGLLGGAAGAVGSIASSSDARGKYGIESQSGSMPGQGGIGAHAIGEAELAGMDSHVANFGKMGQGMQTWYNVSNAKPWSPAATAAEDNANKYFFTSDEGKKTDTSSESEGKAAGEGLMAAGKSLSQMGGADHGSHADVERLLARYGSIWQPITSDTRAKKQAIKDDALAQAGAKMGQQIDDRSQFWDTAGTAVEQAKWAREHPQPAQQQSAADQFMETARPYTYKYKNPGENGGETRLGVMAQDLEKGPTGPDMVKDTPNGKVLDIPAVTSANTAAVGRLHDRLSALEMAMQDGPSIAPKEHGVYSVYDNNTKLTSDTAAKKQAIFQSGVAAGAQAAPQYRVPAVMSDAQRAAVLKATDAYNAHPEVGVPAVQHRIDAAMVDPRFRAPAPPAMPASGAPRQAPASNNSGVMAAYAEQLQRQAERPSVYREVPPLTEPTPEEMEAALMRRK